MRRSPEAVSREYSFQNGVSNALCARREHDLWKMRVAMVCSSMASMVNIHPLSAGGLCLHGSLERNAMRGDLQRPGEFLPRAIRKTVLYMLVYGTLCILYSVLSFIMFRLGYGKRHQCHQLYVPLGHEITSITYMFASARKYFPPSSRL